MVKAAAATTDEADTLKPWELQAIVRSHMLHCQLESAMRHAKTSKLSELRQIDFMDAGSPYMHKLARFYRENFALAGLLDSSDLLLHAEGPGASDHSPRLGAVNWLCNGAERHIKNLMVAMLPMSGKDSRMAVNDLDLRLTGLAPGSLYAGFALAATHTRPDQGRVLPDDEAAMLEWLRGALYSLPLVPQYVEDDRVNRDIMEALPDPALRDAAMVAAYEMSPTGSKGIHTLEISSPRAPDRAARAPQPLGQRERVVLRETLRGEPLMRRTQRGSFVGVLRAIDLDSNRITIRGVSDDIAGLRGAMMGGAHQAKAYLDQRVRIEGEYECAANGMPRMMRVERIERVQPPLDIG